MKRFVVSIKCLGTAIILSILFCPMEVFAKTTFSVTSFPSGAQVWMNGVNTGKVTPIQLTITEGTYAIRISAGAGWNDYINNSFQVGAGANTLSVTLVPTVTTGEQGPQGPSGPAGPPGPVGPPLSAGGIIGTISYCSPEKSAYLPVFVAGKSISARTDKAGLFQLSYLVPGEYNVTIETQKQFWNINTSSDVEWGFGTDRTTLPTISMGGSIYQIPTVVELCCPRPYSYEHWYPDPVTIIYDLTATCICPDGTGKTSSNCIDVLSDRNNCGGIGVQCPPGQICQNGNCRIQVGGECSTGLDGVCAFGTWDASGNCIQSYQSSPEVCDNQDNDCNGLIDDNCDCGPGLCTIDYICWRDGSINQGNDCQYCNPTISKFTWTNLTDGAPCSLGVCSNGTCVP